MKLEYRIVLNVLEGRQPLFLFPLSLDGRGQGEGDINPQV